MLEFEQETERFESKVLALSDEVGSCRQSMKKVARLLVVLELEIVLQTRLLEGVCELPEA